MSEDLANRSPTDTVVRQVLIWQEGDLWIASYNDELTQGVTIGQALERLSLIILAHEELETVKW